MRRNRQEAALLGWLKALPDEVLHCRPVLGVGYAHVLLAIGELEGVEDRLRDAERWLDTPADMSERAGVPSAEMAVVDEEAFRRLPSEIATARAGLALAVGDVPRTVAFCMSRSRGRNAGLGTRVGKAFRDARNAPKRPLCGILRADFFEHAL
jgi:LuxR family maltose regulon positive regulatory protein